MTTNNVDLSFVQGSHDIGRVSNHRSTRDALLHTTSGLNWPTRKRAIRDQGGKQSINHNIVATNLHLGTHNVLTNNIHPHVESISNGDTTDIKALCHLG